MAERARLVEVLCRDFARNSAQKNVTSRQCSRVFLVFIYGVRREPRVIQLYPRLPQLLAAHPQVLAARHRAPMIPHQFRHFSWRRPGCALGDFLRQRLGSVLGVSCNVSAGPGSVLGASRVRLGHFMVATLLAGRDFGSRQGSARVFLLCVVKMVSLWDTTTFLGWVSTGGHPGVPGHAAATRWVKIIPSAIRRRPGG